MKLIKIVTLALVVMFGITSSESLAFSRSNPGGLWLTSKKEAIIRLYSCQNNSICGDIEGIYLRQNKPVPKNWNGASECHFQLLKESKKGKENYWYGKIVDPRNGNIYHVEFHRIKNKLFLRGYILFPLLGLTQTWTKFRGKIPSSCIMNK